jgi:prephenate dehydrogenase
MPEDTPGFFSQTRIAIIGLGLMGGSLALAMKGNCAALLGIDNDPAVLELADKHRVADRLSDDPASLLPEADLIVLAAPVIKIIELLGNLDQWHPDAAVVIDLGSTKVKVTEAMEKLPERFEPVGGHPMCGKEKSSLANAEALLFQGAAFAFTPLLRTTLHARLMADQLAKAIGAHPLWLDPATHDKWVAATSHLPYLLASTLALAVPLEAAPMAGPGFRSTSRLAQSPSSMMMDVLRTNRENILEAVERFKLQLDLFERLLSTDDHAQLQALLDESASRQKEIVEFVEQGGLR